MVLVLFRFPSAALPRPREEGKKSSSVSSSMGVTRGLDIRDESPETCLEADQFARTRDAARDDDLEAMTSGSKPRLCQRSWLKAFLMASFARASESSIRTQGLPVLGVPGGVKVSGNEAHGQALE